LRGLAAAHGADPAVTDCSRVLRLPGFRNCKYVETHFVREVHESPGERAYGPEDFPRYESERTVVRRGEEKQRFSGDGRQSQSERDWAYAMRALERGESPSSIEGSIERFRQDKPSPRYYAQRTVARAMQARALAVAQRLNTDGEAEARDVTAPER